MKRVAGNETMTIEEKNNLGEENRKLTNREREENKAYRGNGGREKDEVENRESRER